MKVWLRLIEYYKIKFYEDDIENEKRFYRRNIKFKMEVNDMKSLVAYFSCSGVTRGVAKKLSNVTNSDLFEIIPEEPYTETDLDWRDKNSRSSIEMNDNNSRPKIKNKIDNINDYKIIIKLFETI